MYECFLLLIVRTITWLVTLKICHNLTNKPNLTKETIDKQLSLETWKFQKTQ